MNKIITTYLGSAHELATIRALSDNHGTEVIAVAFDLANGCNLRELHDAARSAGAARCHVLDVTDAFARECVLPSIRGEADLDCLVPRFAAKKLAEVAILEGDAEVLSPTASHALTQPLGMRRGDVLDRSAQIEITFNDGVPVSLNGVTMTLSELIECVSIIASVHGIREPRAAVHVLRRAYQVLGTAAANGSARLELSKGDVRTVSSTLTTR